MMTLYFGKVTTSLDVIFRGEINRYVEEGVALAQAAAHP